ncbi:DotU/TssL family secretion system protein, partial [Burkholderia multivorans]|uniref:DotU/TssL family secretion system protein n=1 Tax=Burkholderia multivorans TaxID=87883 RepID=UPI002B241A5E
MSIQSIGTLENQHKVAESKSLRLSERLQTVQRARNPLLEAASVLLRAQADMPEHLEEKQILALRMLLEHEVREFEKLCARANIRRDHMIGARYGRCTALDEAAMRTEWGRSGSSGCEWGNRSLATTFHEDRDGGEKVYLLIGRLMQAPDEH